MRSIAIIKKVWQLIPSFRVTSVIRYTPKYTIQDYERWEGDWELWNGVAVAMTPSPFGRHQFVSVNLASELRIALREAGIKAYVLSEIDWHIDDSTVVRPDVVVVESIPNRYLTEPPLFVAEILSESTAEKDRTVKFELYREKGVSNYWIVDPATNALEVYRYTPDSQYESQETGEQIPISILDHTIAISRASLFD